MNDNHFYADVDLPFHVWVREPATPGNFRWVLREAPQARKDSSAARAPAAAGKPRQPRRA